MIGSDEMNATDKEKLQQAVKKRYEHLKLVYGENDPYMAGFRDCMNVIVKETEK